MQDRLETAADKSSQLETPGEPTETIIDRFLHNAQARPAEPALYEKEGDNWSSTTWKTYEEQCRLFAGALIASGYGDGDKLSISGFNCPEWVIADIGGMMARAVPLGIYQTNSPSEFAYIANHSESKIVVLEDREQWEKVDKKRDELPHLERVVMINDAEALADQDDMVVGFDEFLEEGRDHLEEVEQRIDAIAMPDVATMVYTSGTTGDPKGVMLTHKNLAFTADVAKQVVGGRQPEDCMVSYLPLSHIAEQMFTIHLASTFGYPIWFAESLEKVRDAIKAARPTIFFGVPRVWEKFKSAMEGRLEEATGIRKWLVNWARKVGMKAGYQQIEHGEPQGWTKWAYKLADKLVFTKLKERIGLDRLRIPVSAAAPIGKDVMEFFLSFDIIIREVYGQSEDCGPTTVNFPQPGLTKLGTVGLPLPGVEVKLEDPHDEYGEREGEILVKGPNVFKGYYKDAEETDKTLEDGWLHSGDVGQFDDEGFLSITGRKKEIIVTSGGKNVAPQKIEQALKRIDGISQAVVIGDRRKFLSALMTLDPERAPALATQNGWPEDVEALVEHDGFREYVDAEVETANEEFARVETIKKFTLLPHDFTQESGELTPSQKIKRRVVEEKFADEIDAMYPDN
jgi:long-chain acyl-CoA synthetase